MSSLTSTLDRCRRRVEQALDRRLPTPATAPTRLHEAMRYATLNGGKRVRAALVYLTGEALGADEHALDAPACAVELIHAYSLVHDDLPCMDNDDLRRGRPSCHRAYDEATALLVGDALQSLAFELLAGDPALVIDPARRAEMIVLLARAAGSTGMAGGQAIDLASVGTALTPELLEDMHRRKTGALIHAAAMLGVLAAPAVAPGTHAALDRYARAVGLAFQIADDILDVEGETAALGKSAGKDRRHGKPTYVSVLGREGARARARDLEREALDALGVLGDNGRALASLAGFIIDRRQ
ncbi:MAG: farnesyl diphosphate synthase [Pseudomonadota bacterium]